VPRRAEWETAVLMGAICWVVLLAGLWWVARKPRRQRASELQRLQRMAEDIHREQIQPFD